MVLKITDRVIDNLLSRRAKLRELLSISQGTHTFGSIASLGSHLTRVGCQTVPKLPSDLSSLGESFGCKWCQFVAVLLVTCEGEHLGAQPHEPDTEFLVPLKHFHDVSCVSQAQTFNILLAQHEVRAFSLVRPILGGVLWLGWVCKGMPML